jgi:hypothetical protein
MVGGRSFGRSGFQGAREQCGCGRARLGGSEGVRARHGGIGLGSHIACVTGEGLRRCANEARGRGVMPCAGKQELSHVTVAQGNARWRSDVVQAGNLCILAILTCTPSSLLPCVPVIPLCLLNTLLAEVLLSCIPSVTQYIKQRTQCFCKQSRTRTKHQTCYMLAIPLSGIGARGASQLPRRVSIGASGRGFEAFS